VSVGFVEAMGTEAQDMKIEKDLPAVCIQ